MNAKRHRKTNPVNWDNIDWTLDNRTIAAQIKRAYNTVARKRVELGKSNMAATRAPMQRLRESYPTMARYDGKGQTAATQAAKISPIAGKSETNCHAKKWQLTAPNGTVYECTNLYHFIRTHPNLFAPNDVVFKHSNGKIGDYCNATNGLQYAARTGKTWKNWTAKKI